jgi:uncharacterized membrane protein
MDARAEARRSWDLTLIILLSLVLALFIYLVPEFPGRIVLGLPFILFFPGYALIATLFPEKKSLDLIERIALSFGLSIAIVPLIGFGLNYTPFGIRLDPILWSLIAFNTALSVAGMWRRSTAADPFLPFRPEAVTAMARKEFTAGTKVDRVLSVVLVIAILSSVVALVYVVAVPRQGEAFSEFYLLGPGGKMIDYPHNLTVGENASVIVGLANHNYRTINYTVEVWLVNYTYADNTTTVHKLIYMDDFNVTLEHVPVNLENNWTAQSETNYTFSAPTDGTFKLWFILLEDEEPYAGNQYQDYAGTAAESRFLSIVGDRDRYTLNLNLNVAG